MAEWYHIRFHVVRCHQPKVKRLTSRFPLNGLNFQEVFLGEIWSAIVPISCWTSHINSIEHRYSSGIYIVSIWPTVRPFLRSCIRPLYCGASLETTEASTATITATWGSPCKCCTGMPERQARFDVILHRRGPICLLFLERLEQYCQH